MNSRFEKLIATAVLAGALTLAGCESETETKTEPAPGSGEFPTGGPTPRDPEPIPSGTTDPPPPPADTIPPELVAAWTIDASQIGLQFSEPVNATDLTAAPAYFNLNANQENYGFNYNGSACQIGPTTYLFGSYVYDFKNYCTIAPDNSYVSGAPIPIAGIQPVTADPAIWVLDLVSPITPVEDGGTGLLRLTYTGGPGGVEDLAGNPLADISLSGGERGNVLDGVGPPQLISAYTISPTQIELVFSEAVTSIDPNIAAGAFQITDSTMYLYGTPNHFFKASYSWAFTTYANNTMYGTAGVASYGGDPLHFRITFPAPIPANWDDGRGLLRLNYFDPVPPEGIQDLQGNFLQTWDLDLSQRQGNVDDSIQ